MKVSVVTVSYNCEEEIKKTIESVLAQDNVSIEYWIIDGVSTDRTLSVAESYRDQMLEKGIEYHLISEKDDGIYEAMNKGARLATGDVIGFLNCGDYYEKGTLKTVVKTFGDTGCDLMFGAIRILRQDGSFFVKKGKLRKYQTSRDWNHPTTFVKTELLKENPFLNKGIHDDYGFYLKMVSQGRKIVVLDQVLANFCLGGISNKKSLAMAKKRIMDRYRYCYRMNGYGRRYLVECVAMEIIKFFIA